MKRETLFATLINALGGCVFGYNTGIISGLAKPLIQCTLFNNELTESELSIYIGFFNAIILMFATFASPLSVWIAKQKGIKFSLVLLGIFALVFPLTMVCWKNYWYMTIMRGFLGLAVGFASALCPLYASTICDDNAKAKVSTLFQLFICTSICIGQVMNLFFTPSFTSDSCTPLTTFQYAIQLGLSSIFGLLILIVLIWAPNAYRIYEITSSYRIASARRVASSLSFIERPIDEKKSNVLLSCTNFRWIVFCFMLAIMNQLTGINGVIFYAPSILADAGVDNVLVMQILIVGVWNTITVFVFMALVDRLSRRMILNISLGIMIIGCISMIISFSVENVIYLAFIGIILFILGFESGPGSLFFVMASQDFPAALLDQGLSISNVIMWILNIIISFFFPVVTSALGGAVTFAVLGCVQIITLIYFNVAMKGGHMRTGQSDANLLSQEQAPVQQKEQPVNPV